jgi:hypothetical protein
LSLFVPANLLLPNYIPIASQKIPDFKLVELLEEEYKILDMEPWSENLCNAKQIVIRKLLETSKNNLQKVELYLADAQLNRNMESNTSLKKALETLEQLKESNGLEEQIYCILRGKIYCEMALTANDNCLADKIDLFQDAIQQWTIAFAELGPIRVDQSVATSFILHEPSSFNRYLSNLYLKSVYFFGV